LCVIVRVGDEAMMVDARRPRPGGVANQPLDADGKKTQRNGYWDRDEASHRLDASSMMREGAGQRKLLFA
jgi:hypothetical protein